MYYKHSKATVTREQNLKFVFLYYLHMKLFEHCAENGEILSCFANLGIVNR